jgi:ribonuclease G
VKQLLLQVSGNIRRLAIFEDGELMESTSEYLGNERVVGNIYVGRVESVLPGMSAAFVDIGLKKNAFLHFADVVSPQVADTDMQSPKADVPPLRAGEEIVVQVIKDSGGDKGVRLSTNLTIPGKHLVLLPGMNDVGVSRRIEDEEERTRLRETTRGLRPEGMGLIVRTAARHTSEFVLRKEIDYLLGVYECVKKKIAGAMAPKNVYYDGSLQLRFVRDQLDESFDEIIVEGQECCNDVTRMIDAFFPCMKKKVRSWCNKEEMLFDHYRVDYLLGKLMNRKVWLKSGGYIVIDSTEALTVVDVNTGKFVGKSDHEDTVLKVNLEAAREIARQLRLRDIGGIVVIDFIDMAREENNQKVIDRLSEALSRDPVRTHVGTFSDLGILELTRKKVRHSFESLMLRPCPYCGGDGKISSEMSVMLQVVREVRSIFMQSDCAAHVKLNSAVAKSLLALQTGEKPIAEIPPGRKVYVEKDVWMHQGKVEVRPLSDAEADSLKTRDTVVLEGE